MKQEELSQEIRTAPPKRLHETYDEVCETYKQRLLEQFDFNKDDTYWIGNVVGETLDIIGLYFLSIQDIVLIVDNAMPYDEFTKWYYQWTDNDNRYRINLEHWFNGVRPEMFNQHTNTKNP